MGDLVHLSVVTKLPIPVERIIAKAAEAELEQVIVIGVKGGDLFFAASEPVGGDVLWWMEIAKKRLLDVAEGGR